jgi:hypothetical protein
MQGSAYAYATIISCAVAALMAMMEQGLLHVLLAFAKQGFWWWQLWRGANVHFIQSGAKGEAASGHQLYDACAQVLGFTVPNIMIG